MGRNGILVLLASAALQCSAARSPGFSIHDDLLAFPQFEIVFSDGFISEKDAQSLLESSSAPPPMPSGHATKPSTQSNEPDLNGQQDSGDESAAELQPSPSYEILTLAPHRYLCSIPVIAPSGPENETANELAKAEEARQLNLAAVNGWELLTHLEDSCLYFMSGWWSYSLCNNREIVQYHALPQMPNGQAPRRDPHTADYVLGRKPAIPAASKKQDLQVGSGELLPAELHTKGDQRFLVQKLEGGTICDLTGRERTIEVQYHCVPGLKADRIGWIKEVTICTYLMVVNTPSLCNDVAFLPPEETRANPINCQLIDDGVAQTPLLDEARLKNDAKSAAPKQDQKAGEQQQVLVDEQVNIGGVVIGARNVISGADEAGKPPVRLAPPRSYFPQRQAQSTKQRVDVIAQAASKEDGGAREIMSREDLERLDLQPEVVEEMREQMEKIAGDAGWKLEVVELDGQDVRELRGYIDGEEELAEGGEDEAASGEQGGSEGSQERFKDEL